MLKIFLVTMFLAQGAFANNVELKINGDQYYCSKDPNNNSGEDLQCAKEAKKFTQSYNACKSAGNYAATCFDKAYSGVTYKDCADVSEACNDACKNAGNYAPNCYDKCY